MIPSALDRLAESLSSAQIALRNVRPAMDDAAPLPGVLQSRLEMALTDAIEQVAPFVAEVRQYAEEQRAPRAIQQARWLLSALRAGTLSRGDAYVLSMHCDPMTQSEYNYPADLGAELNDPDTIQKIMDLTGYTAYAAGVFLGFE